MEFFWLIIVLSLVLSLGLRYFNSAKAKGIRLENKVHQVLESVASKHEGFTLKDLMLPIGDSTSQIDNVLITSKAMFVIEAKNYTGRIFGKHNQDQWTMTSKTTKTYKNKRGKTYQKSFINKYQFYNPIKQNETHINALRRSTLKEYPIYNLVVFGQKADLRYLNHELTDKVLNIKYLHQLLMKFHDNLTNVLNQNDLFKMREKITSGNIVDKKLRRSHVRNIKKTYSK